jgi:hypothetical protein
MKTVIEVTQSNLAFVVEALVSGVGPMGFDTETTGKEYHDLPFVLTIASGDTVYYFDLSKHRPVIPDLACVMYSHNAKFDLMMLEKLGMTFVRNPRCTMVAERLLCNDRLPKDYSLGATAKRYGMEKDNRVDAYIKAHGLYEVRPTGKAPRFDRVPRDLMKEYATQDAWIHLQIGMKQNEQIGAAI